MKKLFLLWLLLPIFAYSQSSGKVDKTNRFGIGVGYSFNNLLGDSIHPVELNFKYKINEKHSVYLNVPFRISKKNSDYANDYSNIDWSERNNLYGIGCGYNYSMPMCPHLEGFVGVGVEYLHLDNLLKGNQLILDEKGEAFYKSHTKESFNKKAYSLLPQIGIRHTFGHFETEIRYKLYVSRIKEISDYYKYYVDTNEHESFSNNMPRYNTTLQGNMSCGISYIF